MDVFAGYDFKIGSDGIDGPNGDKSQGSASHQATPASGPASEAKNGRQAPPLITPAPSLAK